MQERHTVKVVVLVPGCHVVVSVPSRHDAIADKLRDLESGANGRCGCGWLEECTWQATGLKNTFADNFGSVEELGGICLARPGTGSE
jgi:hypothetical protein